MKITYVGHSTVLIEDGGSTILTDPFFAPKFAFLKRKLPPAMAAEKLPKIDLILVSHTHQDHCDYTALGKIKRCPIVMPKGTGATARKLGFDVKELACWESFEIRGCRITAVPAKHQGICTGYIIEGNKTTYFAGDTFLIPNMEELGKKYRIDIAFLPIGGNVFFGMKMLMDPHDAAAALEKLRPKMTVPIHFGTFGNIRLLFSMNGTPAELAGYIQDKELRNSIRTLGVGAALEMK